MSAVYSAARAVQLRTGTPGQKARYFMHVRLPRESRSRSPSPRRAEPQRRRPRLSDTPPLRPSAKSKYSDDDEASPVDEHKALDLPPGRRDAGIDDAPLRHVVSAVEEGWIKVWHSSPCGVPPMQGVLVWRAEPWQPAELRQLQHPQFRVALHHLCYRGFVRDLYLAVLCEVDRSAAPREPPVAPPFGEMGAGSTWTKVATLGQLGVDAAALDRIACCVNVLDLSNGMPKVQLAVDPAGGGITISNAFDVAPLERLLLLEAEVSRAGLVLRIDCHARLCLSRA